MSSSRPASSRECVNGLTRLASECLDLIIQSCDFYDLMALELAGNMALSSKLEHSISQIGVEIAPMSKWTFLPFRYRQLRSLSVNMRKLRFENPFVVPNDHLLPAEGHKTLEKLRIRSPLAMTLLHNDATYPALSTLLPNLKKLAIHTDGRFDIEMLRNVPSTVTDFRLELFAPNTSEPYPLSVINYLPSTIQTLWLPSLLEFLPDENTEVFLPETLTSLSIQVDSPLPLLKILPKALQSLKLTFTPSRDLELPLSLLPQNLTKLALLSFAHYPTLIIDAPFPHTLIDLDLNVSASFKLPGDDLEQTDLGPFMPPRLTHLSLPYTHQLTTNAPNSVTWMRSLELKLERGTVHEMTNLTYALLPAQNLNLQLLSTLPTTLTHLDASVDDSPEWLNLFSKLINLRKLVISSSRPLPSDAFWSLMHTRLEELYCAMNCFEAIQDLFTDSWTRLKTLEFSVYPIPDPLRVSLEEAASTGDGALLRYPDTIEHLAIRECDASFFWNPIPLLTRVSYLSLESVSQASSTKVPKDEIRFDFLLGLPASLREFSFLTPHIMDPKYLWNLPNGLRSLRLHHGRSTVVVPFVNHPDPSTVVPHPLNREKRTYADLWTEQHIKSLPSQLEELRLRGYQMLDPDLLDQIVWPSCLLQSTVTTSTTSHLTSDLDDIKSAAAKEVQRQRLI